MKNKISKRTLVVISIVIIGLSVCAFGYFSHGFGLSGSSHRKYKSWAMTVPIDKDKAYKVIDVIDGDTIKILIDGHEITTRLLGIDTPEVVDPRKPVQCYGKEASHETKSLLTGKSVSIMLNPDYDRTDKYGRLLGYIYLDGIFVNELLVKEGFAREYTYNDRKPYQFQKLFRNDELKAKQANKGLWDACLQNK